MLVDTGLPFVGARILRRSLADLGIPPESVRLVLLTHGHVDHAGAAAAVRAITGAPVAVHHADQSLLECGKVAIPPSWSTAGKMLRILLLAVTAGLRFPRVVPDIVLDGRELHLAAFGLAGRVIHTPGHTQGSVSLLLDSGEAFVGDLLAAPWNSHTSPGLPPAGDSRKQMLASVRKLWDAGAKAIYPGHGQTFPIEDINSIILRSAEHD